MTRRVLCAVLSAGMLVAGAVTRGYAQGLTAHLSGVVTDTAGGVMPGATITIENVGTNFNYVTGAQTDANFGKLTGATLSARRNQLGVRFTF